MHNILPHLLLNLILSPRPSPLLLVPQMLGSFCLETSFYGSSPTSSRSLFKHHLERLPLNSHVSKYITQLPILVY